MGRCRRLSESFAPLPHLPRKKLSLTKPVTQVSYTCHKPVSQVWLIFSGEVRGGEGKAASAQFSPKLWQQIVFLEYRVWSLAPQNGVVDMYTCVYVCVVCVCMRIARGR